MVRSATTTALKKHIKESPELQKLIAKRKRSRQRLTVALSVAGVLLVVGLGFAARMHRILIQTVTVTGNKIIDTDAIVAVVQADLAGSYAYVVPKKNALIYPHDKIVADLAQQFPRLRNITVSRTGFTSVVVDVVEERGVSLWCGTVIDPLDLSAPCYFVDDMGMIIDEAPHYSGNVYPRFFGSTLLSLGESPLGKPFVAQDSYARLLAFHTELKNLGFSIQSIRLGPGDENAFILYLDSTHTALVRFRAGDDYAILLANLKAAIAKKELSEALKKDIQNLQYFDLRFTNKVYYKFSDDATAQ
jgi:hypothetical protein